MLQHPDITKAERDGGCAERYEIQVIGICVACGEELTTEFEYWTDDEDNKFCDRVCACEYHGIRAVEN